MGGIDQYTPSSQGGVLTNIPPLDNSKILLMGVLTNIPPPPEGGYWPIYPLERILLLSRWVYPGKYPAIQNTIIYFSPYYNGGMRWVWRGRIGKCVPKFWEIGGAIWTDGRRPEVRIDYTPNFEEWGTHLPMCPSQTHRIHIVIQFNWSLGNFKENHNKAY